MVKLLIRLAVNTLAVWVTVLLVPGIDFEGSAWYLLLIGLVLGLVNAVIKPIVKLLSLPVRIVTLGLFTLAINVVLMAVVIWLGGALDLGLSSTGCGTTLVGGVVLALVSWILQLVVPD